MGFFQDLKEDLSQAVNELIPEEETIQTTGSADKYEEVSFSEEVSEAALDDFAVSEANIDITKEEIQLQDEVQLQEEAVPEERAEEQKEVEQSDEALQGEDVLSKEMEDQPEEAEPLFEELAAGQVSEKEAEHIVDETATITKGMTVRGDLITSGSVDILGTINGNVEVLGKLHVSGAVKGNSSAAEIFADSAKITGEVRSKGSVKIGASSVIIGNIYATSAVIAGAVKGDIDVQGPVILDSSAIVMGDIRSKAVQINNGAVIEGRCSQCYADVSPTDFFDGYQDPNETETAKGQK